MTAFMYRALSESARYQPDVISLAASFADQASVLLCRPASWLRGPRVEARSWRSVPYSHVGAYLAELQFLRFRPRPQLAQRLARSALVQFVVCHPAWACAADGVDQPLVLWTATTVRSERGSRMRQARPLRRLYLEVVTRIAAIYERRALAKATFVFALSHYTLNAISAAVKPGRLALAPCGVDTTLFRPNGRAHGDYLLCVARFSDERKNVDLLLRAYARLARRRPALPELYLVGEPPLPETMRLLHRLGIAERVRILGLRCGEELAELYRDAQLFVLSSDEEGLGIVVLEAMASGLPVVSTRCGGPETAVVDGETGFLTPVGDVAALADAIERVLDDPALQRRMGQAGRQRVEERFSLAAAAEVFLRKYDELLGCSASRPCPTAS
jgi:glycosyltransferase involved in cell wall biosynthesis